MKSDRRYTVLAVDDHEHNLRLVTSALLDEGYEVMIASDGEQAIARAAARAPDLILLDILMPGMDGFSVCRRLREIDGLSSVPIIFLSAAGEKDTIVRALEAGGVDYVTKPFHRAELLARVRTHLDLKSARDRLSQLLFERDEFMAMMAHDLKNPLAGLRISAGLLAGVAADPAGVDSRAKRLGSSILNAAERMITLVDAFLEDQERDAAPMTVTLGPIDAESAARGVVARHRESAQRKEIEIQLEALPDAVPGLVLADPVALDQVLDNLVSNAVKFSPRGTRVVIGVARQACAPEAVRFTVSDQGPGFSDQDKEKMFGRFTRLSARPTGGEPSTGLGLSIVKRLVDMMGGAVQCESVFGAGATFIVELPPGADMKRSGSPPRER